MSYRVKTSPNKIRQPNYPLSIQDIVDTSDVYETEYGRIVITTRCQNRKNLILSCNTGDIALDVDSAATFQKVKFRKYMGTISIGALSPRN